MTDHVFYRPAGSAQPPTPTGSTHSQLAVGLTQTPTHALNIVRGWDVHIISLIILFPIFISLWISIIWSVVASVHFKLDPQASTQTGFTIGSYVVTAGKFHFKLHSSRMFTAKLRQGALLIALVAYLDTKINDNH